MCYFTLHEVHGELDSHREKKYGCVMYMRVKVRCSDSPCLSKAANVMQGVGDFTVGGDNYEAMYSISKLVEINRKKRKRIDVIRRYLAIFRFVSIRVRTGLKCIHPPKTRGGLMIEEEHSQRYRKTCTSALADR